MLSKKHSAAFTLIEVVLAVSLLSTLTIFVASSLSQALKAKKKIQTEVEDVSQLRDALRIMKSDIALAYNHYDFEKEIFEKSKLTNKKTNTPVTNQNPFGFGNQENTQDSFFSPENTSTTGRENKREDPQTHFMGEESKISFVTLNNGRMLANEVQADFIEVGYSLKPCKSLKTEQSSDCLWRRVQKIIDADVTAGGQEFVLLENVKEFKLKYLGEGKKEWQKDWKTKGGLDDTTKGLFPDAVEINLGIESTIEGKKREYSLQMVAPLHFPNNVKTNKKSSANSLNSPPGFNSEGFDL